METRSTRSKKYPDANRTVQKAVSSRNRRVTTTTPVVMVEGSVTGHVSVCSDVASRKIEHLTEIINKLVQKVGTVEVNLTRDFKTVRGKIESVVGELKTVKGEIKTNEGNVARQIETVKCNLAQQIETMGETVKKNEEKMTQNLPLNSVSKGGQEGGMSDLTSCDFTVVGDAAKSVFKKVHGSVIRELKEYIKNNWFSRMKFPQSDTISVEICRRAVAETNLVIPKGVSDTMFYDYFKKYVTRSLTSLRHNSQTLARKNWLGKEHTLDIMGVSEMKDRC